MHLKRRLKRLQLVQNTVGFFWFPWRWRHHDANRLRKLVSHIEWTGCRPVSGRLYFLIKGILWPLIGGFALLLVWRRYGKESYALNGRPLSRQFLELCIFTLWYGFGPHEYYERKLFDEPFAKVVGGFIAQYECKILAAALNGAGAEIVKSKRHFDALCADAGLAVVPALFYIDAATAATFFEEVEIPKADLFLKPTMGKRGIGMERWNYKSASGKWCFEEIEKSESDFRAYLSQISKRSEYVVQVAVVNHADVRQYSMSGVVSFRVLTVCDGISEPEAIAAYMVAPRGQTMTNHEAYGGMTAELNLETLRFEPAYSYVPRVEKHCQHPDTGALIEGAEFRDWPKMRDLAIKAHSAVDDVLSVGWDIVYTPQGFLLLEGNTFWGLETGLFLARTPYVAKCLKRFEVQD